MQPTHEHMVEFRGVSYSIGESRIIGDLSFGVCRGEVLVLLGESGCGKTTTLKLINRLIEPTAGEILVNGKRTRDRDAIELRRAVGYVLQDGGLFPHMTVGENVGLTLKLRNEAPGPVRDRVRGMLTLVGLEPAKFTSR